MLSLFLNRVKLKYELNINYFQSDRSEEANNISEDDVDQEKILNFYFISNKFEADWKYDLEIRTPIFNNKGYRNSMDRRGDYIFHHQVKIQQRLLD